MYRTGIVKQRFKSANIGLEIISDDGNAYNTFYSIDLVEFGKIEYGFNDDDALVSQASIFEIAIKVASNQLLTVLSKLLGETTIEIRSYNSTYTDAGTIIYSGILDTAPSAKYNENIIQLRFTDWTKGLDEWNLTFNADVIDISENNAPAFGGDTTDKFMRIVDLIELIVNRNKPYKEHPGYSASNLPLVMVTAGRWNGSITEYRVNTTDYTVNTSIEFGKLMVNTDKLFQVGSPFKSYKEVLSAILQTFCLKLVVQRNVIKLISLFNIGVPESISDLRLASKPELQYNKDKVTATKCDYLNHAGALMQFYKGENYDSARVKRDLKNVAPLNVDDQIGTSGFSNSFAVYDSVTHLHWRVMTNKIQYYRNGSLTAQGSNLYWQNEILFNQITSNYLQVSADLLNCDYLPTKAYTIAGIKCLPKKMAIDYPSNTTQSTFYEYI